jgi:hypothetical protein
VAVPRIRGVRSAGRRHPADRCKTADGGTRVTAWHRGETSGPDGTICS